MGDGKAPESTTREGIRCSDDGAWTPIIAAGFGEFAKH
jgi:hypothetical protein